MASQNSHNSDVYPAIDPKNFEGALKGKVVYITGGGHGIGRGISIAMAKAGATLSLIDLNKDNLDTTVKAVKDLGAEVLAQVCHVCDFKALDKTIEE